MSSAGGGGSGGAAEPQPLPLSTGGVEAADGGAAVTAAASDDDDEIENPCPICLDNKDDATVGGVHPAMCSACGHRACGACNASISATGKCPTCRAPIHVSDEENFKRTWKLVHDRSPGRHTPEAQSNLGDMHAEGRGVAQDVKEAFKWYRCAAEQGFAKAQYNVGLMYYKGQDFIEAVKWFRCVAEQGDTRAQYNLGVMYANGQGVPQDYAEAFKCFQLAAEQGHAGALKALGPLQQHNAIPTPPPGTTITTVLLTSAAGSKYNNKKGVVVVPPIGQSAVKVGRAAVLLEGETKPISFKLLNLRLG